MAVQDTSQDHYEVVANLSDFDHNSGSRLERGVFNNRRWILAVCTLLTLFLGWHALKLPVNASFDDMIPQSHPYIKNYFDNQNAMRGMGNTIRVAVENTKGDIFTKEYQEQLQKINDT